MDDSDLGVAQCMEAQMDATVWIELVIVVLRIVAAGLAG